MRRVNYWVYAIIGVRIAVGYVNVRRRWGVDFQRMIFVLVALMMLVLEGLLFHVFRGDLTGSVLIKILGLGTV